MNVTKLATKSVLKENEKFEQRLFGKRTIANITDANSGFQRTVARKIATKANNKENQRVDLPVFKPLRNQSIGNSKSTARTQVQRNTEQLRKNVQLQNAGRKFPSKSPLMISNNSGSQRARSQSFKPPQNQQKNRKIPPKKLFSQLYSKANNFCQEKEAKLSNLDGLFQELTAKEFEEKAKQAEYEAKEFQLDQKRKNQSQQLKSLLDRIRALEQQKLKLEGELHQSNVRLRNNEDELRVRDKIVNETGKLTKTQESELNKLVQKKRELVSFVESLDATTDSIIQKSRERYYDLCNEQGKAMIIQELLHLKKKQPRKVLFLQCNTNESVEMTDENANSANYSAQLTTDGRKLIIDSLDETAGKKPPKLIELDSIYDIKQYEKLDLHAEYQLDQLKSFFSTTIKTADTKNFNFFFLIQDSEAWKFMKTAFELFLFGKLENIDNSRKIYFIKFHNDGSLSSEDIIDKDGNLDTITYGKYHALLTFALKGDSLADVRIISIYAILQNDTSAADFILKMLTKAASISQHGLIPVEYTPGQYSIEPFLRESLSSSNSFVIGKVPSMIPEKTKQEELNQADSTYILLDNLQKLGTIICNNRLNKKSV